MLRRALSGKRGMAGLADMKFTAPMCTPFFRPFFCASQTCATDYKPLFG
jgi:hypothetical protein